MASFLLLLLLLHLPLSVLTTPHLHHQPLHVSTLSAPPSLSDLLYTLDTSSTPDPAPHLPLFHLDSLLSRSDDPDPTSLLRLRLLRDSARASAIANATRAPRPINFNSSVVSGLPHGSGEYFARIGIGTPLSHAFMVLDTGSDVIWAQCSPCRRCYPQTDPLFDPHASRSFAPVPCSSLLCRRLDTAGCDSRRQSCLYQVSYGDGSSTTGEFSMETFTFRGGMRVGRIAFGCGHDNEGLFVAASGLLGLGRGRLSFPSQAGRRFGRKFSYCLVDRTSSNTAGKSRSSTIVFGDTALPRSGAVYTPMIRNPKLDTFYYVELNGMSVGGARVHGVRASELRLDLDTGRGGVIVDSGTSVTRLARASYVALRDAFRKGAGDLKPAAGFSLFDTCYDLSGRTEVKVPTLAMHFKGTDGGKEVAVRLPAENYMIPVDTAGVFCFAFAGTDSGISIIGNIQQQGFRVVFDGEGLRVGFANGGC